MANFALLNLVMVLIDTIMLWLRLYRPAYQPVPTHPPTLNELFHKVKTSLEISVQIVALIQDFSVDINTSPESVMNTSKS